MGHKARRLQLRLNDYQFERLQELMRYEKENKSEWMLYREVTMTDTIIHAINKRLDHYHAEQAKATQTREKESIKVSLKTGKRVKR